MKAPPNIGGKVIPSVGKQCPFTEFVCYSIKTRVSYSYDSTSPLVDPIRYQAQSQWFMVLMNCPSFRTGVTQPRRCRDVGAKMEEFDTTTD